MANIALIVCGVDMLDVCPRVAGRRGEKVWSLASTQALIEVQLSPQHCRQLQWRLVLPVLQAELRMLQCHHTWAPLFHVCHRWQPERQILTSMLWKCVWLPFLLSGMCILIYQIFYDRDRGVLVKIPFLQLLMGMEEDAKIRGVDHQNRGLFLI